MLLTGHLRIQDKNRRGRAAAAIRMEVRSRVISNSNLLNRQDLPGDPELRI